MSAGNSFGRVFRFTTAGESHGRGLCVIVDGVPSQLALSEEDIQYFLDQRRSGQSRYTSQRREPDKVSILSGVFQGYTTGAPVCMMIDNTDTRSKDYLNIATKFRPGHADFTYWSKYGHRDYRGGGRSSARETVCRVAAGAIARKILGLGVTVKGALIQIGPYKVDRKRWNWDKRLENPFFCPDPDMVDLWAQWINTVRKRGSSTGAIIEIVASGVPVGLGEPVYEKLDSNLARALMTVNAVKGVEIGAGFGLVDYQGEDAVDEMYVDSEGKTKFLYKPRRRNSWRSFNRTGYCCAFCRQTDQFFDDPTQNH